MEVHSYGIEIYNGVLFGFREHKYDNCYLVYFYLPFIAFYYKIDYL